MTLETFLLDTCIVWDHPEEALARSHHVLLGVGQYKELLHLSHRLRQAAKRRRGQGGPDLIRADAFIALATRAERPPITDTTDRLYPVIYQIAHDTSRPWRAGQLPSPVDVGLYVAAHERARTALTHLYSTDYNLLLLADYVKQALGRPAGLRVGSRLPIYEHVA